MLTPLRLLIAAAAGDQAGLAGVAASPADWAALPALARRHELSGVIARALTWRSDIPEIVSGRVSAAARQDAIQALEALSELLRVMTALEAHGIAAVALKGPVLAQWLYGGFGLRRFVDLDVLVRPADRAGAIVALAELGYRLPSGLSPETARVIHGATGAWPLTRAGSYPLDLHWRTADVRFVPPLTPSQIIARSLLLSIGGVKVRMPSPAHTALLVLLHAAKHLWRTLESLYAIAQLLRREDVDWDAVRDMAQEAHAWRRCATGVRLAAELFEAAPPPGWVRSDWRASTNDQNPLNDLFEEGMRALQLAPGVVPDRRDQRRVHRASFDRPGDRLRYDAWELLAPTPLEWQWCPLPDALAPLYVPLRLVRLSLSAVGRVSAVR